MPKETFSLSAFVKKARDLMRQDAGINGDAQRIEQLVWLLFLKIYSENELDREATERNYTPFFPKKFRWETWAHDKRDGKALTGNALIDFVNSKLFREIPKLPLPPNATARERIVKTVFTDNSNSMKDGTLLRQLINLVDEIPLEDHSERHAFGEIYETILRELQSAGSAGEFYTPRPLTDFIAQTLAPKLGERIADLACGTGGFLTSALKILDRQAKTGYERERLDSSLYGIEKKPFPFMLCVTNLLLHGIDAPNISLGNSLSEKYIDLRDANERDKFDVILMNPPYGGSETADIKSNFPTEFRSSETADLFMAVIMARLSRHGRAAVILPDGFLFGTVPAKVALKKQLFENFNLHTVVRLPHSVFAPYTGITTNILFFDAGTPTKETWFYRLDLPEGIKHFSKTKPMLAEHLAPVKKWWKNRRELAGENGAPVSKKFSAKELAEKNYNLDQCGFPVEIDEILSPRELIEEYKKERSRISEKISAVLAEIDTLLKEKK